MESSELWELAENGGLTVGDIFVDQEGNKLIFTGKSFQVYETLKDEEEIYVGMCVGDKWEYIFNDNKILKEERG